LVYYSIQASHRYYLQHYIKATIMTDAQQTEYNQLMQALSQALIKAASDLTMEQFVDLINVELNNVRGA
jgi:hypothetical protein